VSVRQASGWLYYSMSSVEFEMRRGGGAGGARSERRNVMVIG
jgi:hypothetical protein